MTKIAACLIIKSSSDEAPHLKRCLESIKGHVDGIFLQINHTESQKPSKEVVDIAKRYTKNIKIERWRNNFAYARNANFAQVPSDYDWILYLDADDTVDKPKKIRDVCEASGQYDSVYVDYEYDHDEQGNPLTVHMVARLVKNNGAHKWKGSIHETLVEQRSATQGMTKDFMVIHHADAKRTQQSYDRNIKMLEKQIETEQKDPDPRTFYYLASTYMDCGMNDAAKQLFNDYLTMSGWDQERCVAETKLGRMFLGEGDRSEAKKHFMLAIGEDPDNPDPQVEMGSLELEMQQFRKAQKWLEDVTKMKVHQTTLERNPMTYTFRTYLLLTDVYMGMGGQWLREAAKYAKKARKFKADDPEIVKYTKTVEQVYKDKQELEAIVRRYKGFLDKNQKRKAQKVLDTIPERLADNPVVARLRQHNNPFTWPKKSIVIMTGDTALDAWGPWSLQEGIGGSEEAIIRLAPKLAKLGYKVVVYAKPGDKTGMYDGVMWRNFWEWNPEDTFDVFVAWRAPFLFEKPLKARKKYLWLHDVMEEGEFGDNRLKNLDKVIVLSKYHRSLFPMIPDDKIMLSANGIDPEEFDGTNTRYIDPRMIARDPHKILYASSHVRGLAYLYKIWPDVKKAVPQATLDVYYGRESYDKVHKGNPERMKWMDDMIQQAKDLEGVTDHGKVSQSKITQEGFSSGLWAYPCPFPEIYCITAIKSQASGAVPVASNYAALDETIQFGHKQEFREFDDEDLERYRDALIWWLQHPEEQEKVRPEMMAWARTKSWDAVAKQWGEAFNE
jgi:glycosyltransferase involved in cell wall biosynthesis